MDSSLKEMPGHNDFFSQALLSRQGSISNEIAWEVASFSIQPTDETERLAELSCSNLSGIIRAAWAVTLKTFVGSADVTFLSSALGSLNTNPYNVLFRRCSVKVDANSTFAELCTFLEAGESQQQGCKELDELLGKSSSFTADTALILELSSQSRMARKSVETLLNSTLQAFLRISRVSGTLLFEVFYQEAHFTTENAQHLMQIFVSTLTNILSKPLTRFGSPASVQERDIDLLWARNCKLLPASRSCITTKFSMQAQRNPLAPAVGSAEASLTYGELDILSNNLAGELVRSGIGAKDIVPVFCQKSYLAVVSWLAVLKAGACFLLLDPTQPDSRLKVMIDTVNPKIIIFSPLQATRAQLLVISDRLLEVSRERLATFSTLDGTQLPESEPDSPAYVVFTSGSTGTPKGVVITNSSYLSGAEERAKEINYGPGARILDFPPYSFDVSLECNLQPLLNGGCICIPSEHEKLNDLSGAMKRLGVTGAHITPSVSRMLVPKNLSLEWIRLGGEALTKSDLVWADHCNLIIGYGPAECAVTSTLNLEVTPGTDPLNIGRPVGCKVWVVDENDINKLLPIGVAGELLIEGPIVGSEYLHEPEKTRAAFPPPPDWLFAGSRKKRSDHRFGPLYRTGDIGKLNADGSLTFVGRNDTQVKINGQRVELGEVESQLREMLPKQSELVAEVVKAKTKGELVLTAFVVLGKSMSEDLICGHQEQEALKQQMDVLTPGLKKRLPGYMIPRAYIAVSHLPLSVAGKTDRQRLRNLAIAYLEEASAKESIKGSNLLPSTPAEAAVAGAIAACTGFDITSISMDAPASAYSADSLAIMKVVADLRRRGWSTTVSDAYEAEDIASLAAGMTTCKEDQVDQDVKPFSLIPGSPSTLKSWAADTLSVESSVVEDLFPCTPLQEGLISLASRRKGEYISKTTINLQSAGFDYGRFKAAWEYVVKANSILRATILQHADFGFLNCVLSGQIKWLTDADTELAAPMGIGTPLTQFGFTNSSQGLLFVLQIHHAIMDGWTKSLIMQQLVEAYLNGTQSAPLPQFNSFIKYFLGISTEESAAFWRDELADPCCQPFPHPKEASLSGPRGTLTRDIYIPKQRPLAITDTTLLKSAWTLLSAYRTESDRAIFGIVTNGRAATCLGIGEIAGPTLATVPQLVTFSRSETIGQLLTRIQKQAFKQVPYEHFGLQNIQRLGPTQQSLCQFQSLLVVQPQADQEITKIIGNTADDQNSNFKVEHEFSTYAIQIEFVPQANHYVAKISFDTAVVSSDLMERYMDQLQTILNQCNRSNMANTISSLRLLSNKDRAEILEWSKSIPPACQDCVHEQIFAQVTQHPQFQAIEAHDGCLSYQQLAQASTALAAYLVKQGVELETIVPICFEKSLVTVICMISVLKAGGAFVLLDYTHPVDRLQYVVGKVKAKFVLASSITAKRIDAISDDVRIIDMRFVESLQSHATASNFPRVPNNSAAVVLFTSGTTGRPKGMIQEHKTAATSAAVVGEAFGYNTSTRLLQFATYSFDMSVIDILTTLVNGGCVCIPSEQQLLNDLHGTIRGMRVNTLCLTPSIARTLDPDEVPLVQRMVLGGEAIRKDLVEKWSERVVLINGYGPAEGSVCVASVIDPKRPTVVGRSIGSASWILAPDGKSLASVGMIGELATEGPMLARGYTDDPEATNRSFIVDPEFFSEIDPGNSRRIYKSGDLARYSFDGSIEICGRADTQVKVRGQRIELGEVETHVRKNLLPGMDVVAEVIKPGNGKAEPTLVAFVAPISNEKASEKTKVLKPDDLKAVLEKCNANLRETLPKFMLPSAFITLEAMPFTTSGKEDRKALRSIGNKMSLEELQKLRSAGEVEKVAPKTQNEKELLRTWAEVLKVPSANLGIRDNFFDVGGDSITAMRLVAALRSQGLTLTVAQIFQYPVLEDMGLQIVNKTNEILLDCDPFALLATKGNDQLLRETLASLCGTTAASVVDAYPTTALQAGLFALTSQNSDMYVARTVMHLPNDIDIVKFKAAWETVVGTSDILRTRIVQDSTTSELLQVVTKGPIEWQQASTVSEYISRDSASPFELGDSLSRYGLILEASPDADAWCFIWTAHHAIYDGWSKPLLLARVAQTYQEKTVIYPPPFKRFIQYLKSQDHQATEVYWKQQLEGLDFAFPALPSKNYHPVPDSVVRHTIRLQKSPSTSFTLPTFIRAAWALLLSWITGSDDVVVGATVAGRNLPLPGIEELEGPTFTTVPVRVRLNAQQTVGQYLAAVQAQSTEMIPHEHYGLQNIRRLSQSARQACSFQNLQLIQPEDERESNKWLFGTEGQTNETSTDSLNFSSYSIMLVCSIKQDEIGLKLSFDSNVSSKAEIRNILHQLDWALQQLMLSNPDTKVSNLLRTSPADLNKLRDLNADTHPPANKTLGDISSRAAIFWPDLEAVSSWDGILTYSELESASNTCAKAFLSSCPAFKSIVPVFCGKSKWTLPAVLTCAKVGLAFTLLDAGQPMARLKYIVDETKATHIICSDATESLVEQSFPALHKINIAKTVRLLPQENEQMRCREGLVSPSSPLYIVFTSGSTGTPKGVTITHNSYITGALARSKAMRLAKGQHRILDFAAYSFDVSIENMLLAILTGSTLCIPHDEERLEGLQSFMQRTNVTFAHLTPSVARLLEPHKLPSMKILRLGGEAMNSEDIALWKGSVTLLNSYGPTETAVTCLMNLDMDHNPKKIGKGVSVNTWVVDPNNHETLAPFGAIGELLIEGPLVGHGYLNEADKTKMAFISPPQWLQADPFFRDQARLYKTGDLVYYDESGNLIFVGRKDNQVKLNGQRIELGEIEYHIRKSLELKDIAVELIASSEEETILAAFVVRREQVEHEHSLSAEEVEKLTASLSKFLPRYMIPKAFFVIQSLPLNPSGKTDRKQLRVLGGELRMRSMRETKETRSVVKPTTKPELLIQELWSKSLKLPAETILATDSFFDLGGDSIRAMHLIGLARFSNLSLSLVQVFSHPILADLAAVAVQNHSNENIRNNHHVQNGGNFSTGIKDRHVTHVDRTEVLSQSQGHSEARFSLIMSDCDAGTSAINTSHSSPFDFVENRIRPLLQDPLWPLEDVLPVTDYQHWTAQRSGRKLRDQLLYDICYCDQNIDEKRLQRAWKSLVQNYDILRTVFVEFGTACFAVVVKDPIATTQTVAVVDSSVEDAALAWCREDSDGDHISFGTPFAHLTVLTSANGSSAFVLRISHAQYDGVSLHALLHELVSAYNTDLAPAVPSLAFTAYLKSIYAPEKATMHQYWRTRLLHSSMSVLTPSTNQSADLALAKSHETRREMTLPSRPPKGITMATVVTSCWALLLSSELSKSHGSYVRDITFGRLVSGRNVGLLGVESTMGPCINVVPARVEVTPHCDIQKLLESVQAQSIADSDFETIRFRELVTACTKWPHGADFDSVVQHQNIESVSGLELEGVGGGRVQSFIPHQQQAKRWWLITVPLADGRMRLKLTGREELGMKHGERILEKLGRTLELVLKRPDAMVEEVLTIL